MGLDVGTKRIGVSLSDALGFTAQPYETIPRQPEENAIAAIKKICTENNVKKIVIGLPKMMNGTIGEQAEDCIKFSDLLKSDFEIIFEDERLTSRQAEKILALQGKKFGLCVSFGDYKESFELHSRIGFSVDSLLAPFQATFRLVSGTYIGHFATFRAMRNISDEDIAKQVIQYKQFLENIEH